MATIGTVVNINDRLSPSDASFGGLGTIDAGSSRLVMLISYFNGAGQHTDATVFGQSGTFGWRISEAR